MPEPAALVLASASPRRTELLHRWSLDHCVVPSDAIERDKPGESADVRATRLATEKARAVAGKLLLAGRLTHGTRILAADTLVSLNETHFGKPVDDRDALAILMLLAGNTLQVTSGVAVVGPAPAEDLVSGHCMTLVKMRPFGSDEARRYVETGEPMGKAGAFAVQGQGRMLIDTIEGSFSNVVGLPRSLVFELLERTGWSA